MKSSFFPSQPVQDSSFHSSFFPSQSSTEEATPPIKSSFFPEEIPQSVLDAQGKIGSQDDNGFCERFVEQHVYGKTGLFPSAIDAANYYKEQGELNPDLKKAPAGSMVYFNADSSNENAGHVAIYDGKGNIIGATDNGVQSMPIDQWLNYTKQQPLGFVHLK